MKSLDEFLSSKFFSNVLMQTVTRDNVKKTLAITIITLYSWHKINNNRDANVPKSL